MRLIRQYLLLLLIVALFVLFLGWPIYQTVRVGFQGIGTGGNGFGKFTFAYVLAVFQDPLLREGLLHSVTIAVCVTFLCTIISVPLALLSRRYDFWGKGVMNGLLLVPLILPPFVGAIGMRQILGRFGVLTALSEKSGIIHANAPVNWFGSAQILGVILVETLSLYPILFLNVSAALANLDPAMEQAASNLGAKRWTIFRRITLPLMRPGLFAGGTIVLIWSFTELGTPLMFDYTRVTPVQIFNQISQVNSNPLPYALTVVMLISSVLLYIVGKFVLGKKLDAAVTKASTQGTSKKLGIFGSIPVLIPFVIVSLLALMPHFGVVLMSVSKVGGWYQSAIPQVFTAQNYRSALSSDVTLPAVQRSIEYASLSTVVDIGVGLMIAFLIVRSRLPNVIKQGIDSIAMLPLAVPGLVMAFGYLALGVRAQVWVSSDTSKQILNWLADHLRPLAWIARHLHITVDEGFRNTRWLRNLVDSHENPTLLLVIAYAMRRLPYVVRSAVAGLEQTPVDLELAARNLGASSRFTLRKITLPLISANLIAGGLLAFAFAMLEVSDSLMLAQKQDFWPITRGIYELFQRLGDGPYIASALGVWAMVLLTLTILSANSMLGKRMGAIFRV
jgi:iron(III) transport system permease protein